MFSRFWPLQKPRAPRHSDRRPRCSALTLEALEDRLVMSAAGATHPGFVQQPTNTLVSSPIAPPVTVGLLDQFNNAVSFSNDPVSVALGNNTAGATLGGTTTVTTNPLAQFNDLSIPTAGTGYTLVASDPNLATPSIGLSIAGVAGEIAVNAFQASDTHSPGGIPSLGDFTLNLPASAADPGFLTALAQGQQFSTATLHVRNAAGQEYLTYIFTNATFPTLSTSSGGNTPIDILTVHFEQLGESYRPVNKDGTLGPRTTVTYDVTTGLFLDKNPVVVQPSVSPPTLGLSLDNVRGEIALDSLSESATSSNGMTQFNDFTVSLQASTAEPGLLANLITGDHFKTAAIHVRDAAGQEYLTYNLTIATITTLTTTSGASVPEDFLTLHFVTISETYDVTTPPANSGMAAADTFTFDTKTGSVLAAPPIALPPSPSSPPALSLSFAGVTGEIALNNYSENAVTTNGLSAFSDFSLQLPASQADPGLLAALARGQQFSTATIHVRDAFGQEYLTYTLTGASVTGLGSSTADGSSGDILNLHFNQVTEAYRPTNLDGTLGTPTMITIDTTTGKVPPIINGSPPGGSTPPLSPSAGPAPLLGLTFPNIQGEIALQSIQENASSSNGLAGFGDFTATLQASVADPELLASLAGASRPDTATLHVRNAAGQEYITYTLTNASVTSLSTESSGSTPLNTLTIHFDQVSEAYRKVSPKDGTLENPLVFTYDGPTKTVLAAPTIVLPPTAISPPTQGLSIAGVVGELPLLAVQENASKSPGGIPTFSDFTVQLLASAADPGLLAALAGGQQLGTIELHVRNAAGQEYLTYTLAGASVTAFATQTDGSTPVDTLQLHFTQVKEDYAPTSPDNLPGNFEEISYDPLTGLTDSKIASFVPPASPPSLLSLSYSSVQKNQEIALQSLQENISQSPNGVPSFGDFTLTLQASGADPALLVQLTDGRNRGTAILHVRNENDQEYLTYTLTEVTVTGLSTAVSGNTPFDTLTLHFATMTETVQQLNPDGTLGARLPFTYDTGDSMVTTASDIVGPTIQTSTTSDPFTVNNPVPVLTSLGQSSVNQGSPTVTLTVNGSSFVAGSTVQLNSTPLPTTFVSDTALTAVISATFLTNPAAYDVTVANPAPGGGTSAALTFSVLKAPPTASLTGPTAGVPGQPRTFTLLAADPSPADQNAGFTFTINWGDGSPVQTVVGQSGIQVNHVFTQPRTDPTGMVVPYQVQLTATDKDGATGPATMLSVLVQTAQLQGTTLAVGGTTGNDHIMLHPTDANGDVQVVVNSRSQGIFHPTGQILIYSQAGNDVVRLESRVIHGKTYSITVPAIVYGGNGNDVLDSSGSSAANVLLGGAGNDVLLGGPGPTVLIGGGGNDQLFAGGGDTILIGGTTDYDPNGTTLTPDQQLQALDALLAEWARTDLVGTPSQTYVQRVNDLLGPAMGGTAAGLNGSYFLNVATVHSDGVRDALFGGGQGLNWFFADAAAKDLILRHRSGEVITQE